MRLPRLNPITQRKLARFRSIRRGYVSLLLLSALVLFSLTAELFINSRALIVSYDGKLFFPTYTAFHPGTDFGLSYSHETNYKELQKKLSGDTPGWVLMPLIPHGPYENCYAGEIFRPREPDIAKRHFLGTDQLNRDIFARLIYGFRIAIVFSVLLLLLEYAIGVSLGCAMGYFGGRFDLFSQRLIEIWSNIPFLYVVIIVASVFPTNQIARNYAIDQTLAGFVVLLLLMVLFSWTGMTYYMRTASYKEKAREYVHAAQVIGASTPRIIFRHILPNILSTLITFAPFTIAGGMTALTALDFLGFGLQPPIPSWGELLKQGTENLDAPWIASAAVGTMVAILTLVTFVGEAIREAFDPKKFTTYQ